MSSNKQRPVTIKSIAQELGISFSTVSKALNDSPLIKKETKEMVLQKANEMGYTPNTLAKGLRGNSTKTIAVIFNDIENPSLTYIFKNISIEMSKYGYTTIILDSQFNEKIERSNILTVLSRQPDFIILEPAAVSPENLKLLREYESRLILQGARYDFTDCHQVLIDYAQGGYQAACELLSNHHRDCLVITEPLSFPISAQFVQGIQKAFAEYGIPFSQDRIKTTRSSIASGFQVIRELWDYNSSSFTTPFTGVLTFDDHLAHGVYKAAAQFHLRVPEDISVIGFDDNPLSSFSMPPLSTVHLPKEKIAESCIQILHAVLLKHQTSKCIFSLEPNFIRRESVCNLLEPI